MSFITIDRLIKERKEWRKNHPFGFIAKPRKYANGSINIRLWDCAIPGKKSTPWEGGLYRLEMYFSGAYPDAPPECIFNPPIFHPNVSESGTFCFSLLTGHTGWDPSITITMILLALQEILHKPNIKKPAQKEASEVFRQCQPEYVRRVMLQAKQIRKNK